jgi:hypothetical protein
MYSMRSHQRASFGEVLYLKDDMAARGPTPDAKIAPWRAFASMVWRFSKGGPFEAMI